MKKLDRFQRWAVATTAATYLLIGVGGLVRAAGAGLGCPDWPRCFDRWIPPTDVSQVPPHIDPALFNFAKAWIEYINRLIGVTTGILIFVTLVLALKDHRRDRRITAPTIAAFLLVGFEGWLGGQVVRAKLAPLVLSAHLAAAMVIVGLLVYATVCAFFPPEAWRAGLTGPNRPAWRRNLSRGALAVAVVTLLQIAMGAVVRGEIQEIGKLADAPPRDQWLANVGWSINVHSNFAVVVAALVVAVVVYSLERARALPALRVASFATAALLVLQVGAGIAMVRFDLPPSMQVLHLWFGCLLPGALLVIALLPARPEPSSDPSSSGSAGEAGPDRSAAPETVR